MKHRMRKSIGLLAIIPTMLLATSQLSAGEENAEFTAEEFWYDAEGTLVDVVTPFEFESMELRVRKRGETEVWTESFGPGVSLSVDLAHIVESGLTDDRYTYEVRFVTGYKANESSDLGNTMSEEPIIYSTSGSFSVENGSITDVSIPGYRGPGNSKGNTGTIQSDSNLEASEDPSLRDVSDAGDLAIGGYGIFGSSNTGDVVPGKVRVLASDGVASLSVQAEASNGDDYAWHFGTQDGGDFGLQRQRTTSGAKTTVLGIEEDADANSLMIDANGNIGFGTATPENRLHIVGSGSGSNNPRIRYENPDHSISWLAGAWSSDSFVIRNDSGGATPLRIYDSAGNSSLVARNDNVGIGIIAPAKALHVRGSDAGSLGANNTMLRVENNNGTPESRRMLELVNNGSPLLVYENTETGEKWSQNPVGGQFTITKGGTGQQEFQMDGGGNVVIQGSLTENSMRASKTEFRDVDERDILERLNKLPMEEWSYKHSVNSRHLGPMAEDFHNAFGLGPDNGIAPRDLAGVALAAAKALKAENDLLRNRLDQLEEQISQD